jgi:hypothetical protein
MSREQPMSITSGEESLATNPEVFAAIFQRNWENVRDIKSERMWFLNTHAITSAGTLSLFQTIHGESVRQLSLLLCMCVLSAIGLLTSLRLKAELEECLEKIQAMVARAQMDDFMALWRSVTAPRLPVDLPGALLVINGVVFRTLRVSTGARTAPVRSHLGALRGASS